METIEYTYKLTAKFIQKYKTIISSNLKKEQKEFLLPDFKTYCEVTIIKIFASMA